MLNHLLLLCLKNNIIEFQIFALCTFFPCYLDYANLITRCVEYWQSESTLPLKPQRHTASHKFGGYVTFFFFFFFFFSHSLLLCSQINLVPWRLLPLVLLLPVPSFIAINEGCSTCSSEWASHHQDGVIAMNILPPLNYFEIYSASLFHFIEASAKLSLF